MSVQTEPIEITSPIVLSADSNKDVNLPPTKKFQDNNKELGSVPQVPAEILSPSIAPTSTHPSTSSHLESQSSLSRADPTDANRMIEAVWEARMDAYISDRFAEQEIANNKKLVANGNKVEHKNQRLRSQANHHDLTSAFSVRLGQ